MKTMNLSKFQRDGTEKYVKRYEKAKEKVDKSTESVLNE